MERARPDARSDATDEVRIRTMRRGDPGWILHRQAVVYDQEYGYGSTFETYFCQGLFHFLAALDADRDRLWIAETRDGPVGSVALHHDEKQPERGQLRWFFVEPHHRGNGTGRRLIDHLLSFARQTGYRSVFLWTVDELHGARRLYEQAGFRLVEDAGPAPWAHWTHTQKWELRLDGD